MGNKQDARAGKDSTINQAQRDLSVTNHYGISYQDAKEIAMDTFKFNFVNLGVDVEKLVNERAEAIIGDYLEKLSKEDESLIYKTKDPDIRFKIYEAQKHYARFGKSEVGDILVDLLVERTKSENEKLIALVLNEALEIVPKITKNQIDIVVFIFLIRYLNFLSDSAVSFSIYNQFISEYNFDFDKIKSNLDIEHLEYSGCLTTSIGEADFNKILKHKNLQGLKEENQISELIRSSAEVKRLESIWNTTNMKHCTLSTVGKAIAITQLNSRISLKLSYDTWFD